MKKIILVLLLLCNVFFLSFARGLFEEPETIIKKKLLKCKDVVDVEVETYSFVEFLRIYVKLTDDRYIEFGSVDYSLCNKELTIIAMNDIVPMDIYYEVKVQGRTDLPDYHMDNLSYQAVSLEDINHYFRKTKSIQDIINNFDQIYRFINSFSVFPQTFKGKNYKLYDTNLDFSDWDLYESDYQYILTSNRYHGRQYKKFYKLTMDEYNELLFIGKGKNNPAYNYDFRRNYFKEKEKVQ